MESSLETREKITGEIAIPQSLSEEVKKSVPTTRELGKLLPSKELEDTTLALGFLLASALRLDASDIHGEPRKEGVNIRFRIDGLLQDVAKIPSSLFGTLLSRIKLISGIKLNVADKPQDGRFSLLQEREVPIEVRSSTLPSEYGESVVLRILNPKSLLSTNELGLQKDLEKIFKEEVEKPNGMIMVTGPTGSGKTTTLYAFLREVQKPSIKVITIEDPIEYHLEGISQTQVAPEKGYDFASGLRAIVRQDPDVILVGEIRDGETAEIALQASLTGHLVFSTLHTNDAAGTIARLTALGSALPTIASALTLIVAQRLVRKVCSQCARFVAPSPEQLKKIREGLGIRKHTVKKIPSPVGCALCNFTGYKGRVGIFEGIQVDAKTEEFILSGPSISAFKDFAVKKGMITMFQDGLLKVLEGITTLEEVERVVNEE